MSKIQVVILAGGEGSRLRPYTTVLPKPLLPVGDYPIIDIIIRQLKAQGFEHIAISTGYLADLIKAYCEDGRKWGIKIAYIKEDQPLGTAGALKLVHDLADDFLVINGDILTDLNFSNVLSFHSQNKALGTISVIERVVKTDFGVIEINDQDELDKYIEKPEHKSFVSIGVYALNNKALNYILPNKVFGMPELMLALKSDQQMIKCFRIKNIWYDLGRLDDFESVQQFFAENKEKFLS